MTIWRTLACVPRLQMVLGVCINLAGLVVLFRLA